MDLRATKQLPFLAGSPGSCRKPLEDKTRSLTCSRMQTKPPLRFFLTALTAVLSLVFSAQQLLAEDIFADTFHYPAGALAGNGPPAHSPSGESVWSNVTGTTHVAAGGLQYAGVPPDAGKAVIAGLGTLIGDEAVASTPHAGGSGSGLVWIGFLMNRAAGSTDTGGFAVVSVGTSGSNPGIGIGVLDGENIYGIDNNSESPVERARTSIACNNTVRLVVVKLDFNSGVESIYIDPVIGRKLSGAASSASQPMGSEFRASGIDAVQLVAGTNESSFNISSLRIGTELADVLPAPTVTITATVPQVTASSGEAAVLTLSRTGGDLTKALLVAYSVKGTAKPGADYTPLVGTKRFKPGQSSVQIDVDPKHDLKGDGKLAVTLHLEPKADYVVGTPAMASVRIATGP
jgi:hypothetical protein